MPELPEVETVRRDLAREATGDAIVRAQIFGARTVRRQPAKTVVERLTGQQVVGVDRQGNHLVVVLGSGDRLVVHLRMSGQLRKAAPDDPYAPHTHAVLAFARGWELRFVDPRTFGELFVVGPYADGVTDADADAPVITPSGPDALTGAIARSALARLLRSRRIVVKAFLLDQRMLAGIGNIYADEICHAARIRPDRRTDSLTDAEIRRLHRAIPAVLAAAIEARGSSLADEQYVDLYGRIGGFQHQHRVHARTALGCGTCGGSVVRTSVAQRGTYLCPQCQR